MIRTAYVLALAVAFVLRLCSSLRLPDQLTGSSPFWRPSASTAPSPPLAVSSKPKSARVKRALEEREPKVVENPKTAIFVHGNKTGERVAIALKELVRPWRSCPPWCCRDSTAAARTDDSHLLLPLSRSIGHAEATRLDPVHQEE